VAVEVLEGEDHDVAIYLMDRFRGLGFNDDDAEWLALAGADWHVAAELVTNRCPLDTVMAILG
jgi:hypothetical protein